MASDTKPVGVIAEALWSARRGVRRGQIAAGSRVECVRGIAQETSYRLWPEPHCRCLRYEPGGHSLTGGDSGKRVPTGR
jgi:hypothetical protein